MGNNTYALRKLLHDKDDVRALQLIKSCKNKNALRIRDTFGNTFLMMALDKGMKSVAMEILNDPALRLFNISTINVYGSSALTMAILSDEEIALKILQYPHACTMDVLGSGVMIGGNTQNDMCPLALAINNEKSRIALKMLEYPALCQLDWVDSRCGDTILTLACKKSNSIIAMKILEIGDWEQQCNNEIGPPPIMYACMNGMSEVALEILAHTNVGVDYIRPNSGYTCLMYACKYCTENVALKILENFKKCNATQYNYSVNDKLTTALTIAHDRKFTQVVEKLLKHHSALDLLGISKTKQSMFEKYMQNDIMKFVQSLPDINHIKANLTLFNTISDKVKRSAPLKDCLICGEEQSSNTVYVKCKHIVSMCNVCSNKLNDIDNRCPICRIPSNVINDAYII